MLAEIITIGDEILIGQIVDTNSAFISKALNAIGVEVVQITSIKDDREPILKTLEEAGKKAKLVLITGGLGPTKDDITKETLCEYFDDTLVEDPEVVDHINGLFRKYFNRNPLEANLRQAMVPSKATVLKNDHGTAPGLWMQKDATVYVSMPGVPYEMKHLLTEQIIPRIIRDFETPHIYHKTLLTYGLGESAIAERIVDWENKLPENLKLAYLPSLGRVRLRLTAKGSDEAKLHAAVNAEMAYLERHLADIAVGFEGATSIEQQIGLALSEKGQTLSLAESCTGGAIAERITSFPGASAYFRGGIIPYETQKKVEILGVEQDLIATHSVVSAEVAHSMALHVQKMFNSDYALSTTGVAGPTKGDTTADVGTVYIGLAGPDGVRVSEYNFGRSRERVIAKTANKGLELLYKEISKN